VETTTTTTAKTTVPTVMATATTAKTVTMEPRRRAWRVLQVIHLGELLAADIVIPRTPPSPRRGSV
jgi:hypothetical protein